MIPVCSISVKISTKCKTVYKKAVVFQSLFVLPDFGFKMLLLDIQICIVKIPEDDKMKSGIK